ncbi:MAG: toxin ParE1/3/4 [Caulobacter sp.]|jgi:plasmid stabilization system protein ParE|nr:toxin ParE1/3/4 [Caulobacter sp.]
MKLIWTSKAHGDLVRLHAFLAPVAPIPAKRALQLIVQAAKRLVEHPRMGERIEGHESREVRRLIVSDYELQYELVGDILYVTRIWHGREDR